MKKIFTKLTMAVVCSIGLSGVGSAIAKDNNTDNPPMRQSALSSPNESMGVTKEWQMKQWDKKQWDRMSRNEQTQYKTQHQNAWNNMTPEQREAARVQHRGQKNYMSKNWDNNVNNNVNNNSQSLYKGGSK